MSEQQPQQAFISRVHLKGYKSIRDMEIDFKSGLNIIIGPNGSGKSNFSKFINAIYLSDFKPLLNGIKFSASIVGETHSIQSSGGRVFQKKGVAYSVRQIYQIQSSETSMSFLFDEEKKLSNSLINSTTNPFSNFRYLFQNYVTFIRFENPMNEALKDKLKLALNFYEGEIEFNDDVITDSLLDSHLESQAVNTFLNNVFLFEQQRVGKNDNDVVDEILKGNWFKINDLCRNLSFFTPIKDVKIDWNLTRKIVHKSNSDYTRITLEGIDFQFFINGEWFNWSELSDGTKRLFYLFGSVTYASNESIILIEEPELGIHPNQLSRLMDFLREQSETKQIIITTHSPQILNALGADELDRIIVTRHEGERGTQMYHLSEEEKGFAQKYMENGAFLSDYWVQSGFMQEEDIA